MTMDFRIDKSTVENLSDDELFWAIIKPIWPDLSVKNELEHIQKGTPGQRAIFSIILFIREVDNGGLEQFFLNSSGIYSMEVLNGFMLLQLTQYADILQQAFELFPKDKIILNNSERQLFIESSSIEITTKLEKLSNSLYGEKKLYPAFKKYIEQHPEDFFYNL